ncbi:MAG: AMP-binding protein [Desulfobacterales bacterium]|nr:AMP-binding protein [Desulfobacterales bacterium]
MKTERRKNNFNNQWKLPLLPDYIMRWADLTPENDCIVFADSGRVISYGEFDRLTDLYAMRLKEMGIEKEDIVVTQFLAVPEFYMLIYGCLKAGGHYFPAGGKRAAA